MSFDDDTEAPSTSATHRTTATTPSGGSTHHTISFDHNVKTTNVGTRGNNRSVAGAGLLFGMSKPMLFGVTALLLSTSGAAAYFFRSWLSIPGLNNQIEKLQDQIQSLNLEIDRLESSGSEFYERVHKGYHKIAELDPIRVKLIDASKSIDQINKEIWEFVAQKMNFKY